MSVYLDGKAWEDRIYGKLPQAQSGDSARYYSIKRPDGTVVESAAKLEILNPITQEGTPTNAANLNNILAAMGTTSGTASALTLEQEGFTLFDGATVRIKLHVDTEAGVTLDVGGTGAKETRMQDGSKTPRGRAGIWYEYAYSAETDAWVAIGSGENTEIGEMRWFGYEYENPDYHVCDGAVFPKAEYPTLWDKMGKPYGDLWNYSEVIGGATGAVHTCYVDSWNLFIQAVSGPSPEYGLKIYTSADGIVWTVQAEKTIGSRPYYVGGIVYSPSLNKCVILAWGYDTDYRLVSIISNDGVTWTEQYSSPTISGVNAHIFTRMYLTWSPEKQIFLALKTGNNGGAVLGSTNGEVWTVYSNASTLGSYGAFWGICWAAELDLFVAIGSNDQYPNYSYRIWVSPDGITWTYKLGTGDSGSSTPFGICWSPELNLFLWGYPDNGGVPSGSSTFRTFSPGTNWTLRPGLYVTGIATRDVVWASHLNSFIGAGSTKSEGDYGVKSVLVNVGITGELTVSQTALGHQGHDATVFLSLSKETVLISARPISGNRKISFSVPASGLPSYNDDTPYVYMKVK